MLYSFLLVSALNATVAVQRVQSRQRQLEEENESSVLVSQVLNPDVPLNQPGNIRKGHALCFFIMCHSV